MDQALASSFLLDPEQTEREKRLRERQFHVIDIPRLRVLGFVILTLLVIFHEVFSTGETNWQLPLRIEEKRRPQRLVHASSYLRDARLGPCLR